MNCPYELVPIIGRIIELGILAARVAAWQGDANRSAVEADHIAFMMPLV